MSKTLGESFNVDSEQEMYFTEKKPQPQSGLEGGTVQGKSQTEARN